MFLEEKNINILKHLSEKIKKKSEKLPIDKLLDSQKTQIRNQSNAYISERVKVTNISSFFQKNQGKTQDVRERNPGFFKKLSSKKYKSKVEASAKRKIPTFKKQKTIAYKIGFRLFLLNIERIITFMILLTILIPIFNYNFYFRSSLRYKTGLVLMGQLANSEKQISPDFQALVTDYMEEFTREINESKIKFYLQVGKLNDKISKKGWIGPDNSEILFEKGSLADFKDYFDDPTIQLNSSFSAAESVEADTFYVASLVLEVDREKSEAILSVFRTFLIILILSLMSTWLRKDIAKLIVQPILKIKKMVHFMQKNPTKAHVIIDWHLMPEIFDSKS